MNFIGYLMEVIRCMSQRPLIVISTDDYFICPVFIYCHSHFSLFEMCEHSLRMFDVHMTALQNFAGYDETG
jgi:hypothetical protein